MKPVIYFLVIFLTISSAISQNSTNTTEATEHDIPEEDQANQEEIAQIKAEFQRDMIEILNQNGLGNKTSITKEEYIMGFTSWMLRRDDQETTAVDETEKKVVTMIIDKMTPFIPEEVEVSKWGESFDPSRITAIYNEIMQDPSIASWLYGNGGNAEEIEMGNTKNDL